MLPTKNNPIFIEATEKTIDGKLKDLGLTNGAGIYYNHDRLEDKERDKYELFMHKTKDNKTGWMLHYCLTVKLK